MILLFFLYNSNTLVYNSQTLYVDSNCINLNVFNDLGCKQRPSHEPYPRLLRHLLLRGEDSEQGAGRVHGGGPVRPVGQHEQTARVGQTLVWVPRR